MRFVRTAENLFGLPQGFTRLEYLQSTGTQYIDTGVKLNSNSKVDLMYEPISSISTNGHIFGARDVAGAGEGFGIGIISSKYVFDYKGRITASSLTIGATTKYRIIKNKESNKVYVDGNEVFSQNNTTQTFTLTNSSYLFRMNDAGTSSASSKYGRIYYCKIWDNGVLVRDFIPCIDPLGVACMYDLVGKKPYYNQGTGTFTAGRQIIPVKYLQSTGTQYINTGHAFTDNFAWEIDFEGILDNTTLFGGRTSSARTALLYQRVEGGINVTTCPIAGLNGANTPFQLSDLRTGRHTVKMAVNANKGSVWVDGIQSYNEQSFTGTYISGTTQALFADNFGSSVSEYTSSKVYALKMWQGLNLVRDFIPCKDENNVGFMFDKVSGTCYLNAGTGAFSVGENKYTSKLRLIKEAKELPDGYKRVEYLESTGEQYIDTEYTINTTTDEVLFNFQMVSTTLYQWIMGEHDNGARFGVGVGDGTNKRNIAYGSTTYKVNDTEIYNSIHYFKANSNGVYLNGTQVHGFETFSSSSNVYLFKLNLSGANGAAGKIWRYTQKRNGVLIRDMIPCLDPNNTPCMFDLVEGKPYYNQGTGSFSYGHQIIPVEYLESTGTQYINSGIKTNNDISIEYDGIGLSGTTQYHAMGYYVSGSQNTSSLAIFGSSTGGINAVCGLSDVQYRIAYNDGNWTDRHKVKLARGKLYVDDVYIGERTPDIVSYNDIWVMAINSITKHAGRCYSSKIWKGDTLVRDFIPVRDENNVGYMFDRVTGSLFGNNGTGAFSFGNDLSSTKIRFIRDAS